MKTHFDINPLNKVYHLNDIEVIVTGMEKQLELFVAKNSDKKDLVEEKKEQLIALKEAQIFLLKVYKELESEKKNNLSLKILQQKHEALIIAMKEKIDHQDEKYNNLINFDK